MSSLIYDYTSEQSPPLNKMPNTNVSVQHRTVCNGVQNVQHYSLPLNNAHLYAIRPTLINRCTIERCSSLCKMPDTNISLHDRSVHIFTQAAQQPLVIMCWICVTHTAEQSGSPHRMHNTHTLLCVREAQYVPQNNNDLSTRCTTPTLFCLLEKHSTYRTISI